MKTVFALYVLLFGLVASASSQSLKQDYRSQITRTVQLALNKGQLADVAYISGRNGSVYHVEGISCFGNEKLDGVVECQASGKDALTQLVTKETQRIIQANRNIDLPSTFYGNGTDYEIPHMDFFIGNDSGTVEALPIELN